MASFKFAGLLVSTVASFEAFWTLKLTPTNWEMETNAGTKDVFLKFCKPKNPECQAMGAEWTSFMKEWAGHKKVVVAEVDCEGDGSPICSMAEVTSFPTILYGNPKGKDVDKLKKFQGAYTFQDFHKTAVIAFGAPKICKPGKGFKFCDGEQKLMITHLQGKTPEELSQHLVDTRGRLATIDKTFDTMIDKVSKKMEKLQDEFKLVREDEAKEKELQEKMDSLQTQLTSALKIKDDSVKKIIEQNGLNFAEMILAADLDGSEYDPDLDEDIEQPEVDADYDPDFDDDKDEF